MPVLHLRLLLGHDLTLLRPVIVVEIPHGLFEHCLPVGIVDVNAWFLALEVSKHLLSPDGNDERGQSLGRACVDAPLLGAGAGSSSSTRTRGR